MTLIARIATSHPTQVTAKDLEPGTIFTVRSGWSHSPLLRIVDNVMRLSGTTKSGSNTPRPNLFPPWTCCNHKGWESWPVAEVIGTLDIQGTA